VKLADISGTKEKISES